MTPHSDDAVIVEELTRTYRVPIRAGGLRAALASVVRREFRTVEAVTRLSFRIPAGQVVGLIGPNGAGKTTTMKLLAGVLQPTAGSATVLGYRPGRRERSFLASIALLRGSQPIGGATELTVQDQFQFRRLLYEIPRADCAAHLAELEELLGLGDLLHRQVRALSLGQRMRAGLALALLHRPRVLFLDEPTIGLDASAALAFRDFVARYAATTGAAVILTSHYLAEVEALCSRIILIDKGRPRFDGALATLARELSSWKEIRLTYDLDRPVSWQQYGDVISDQDRTVSLRVDRDRAPEVAARLLAEIRPTDVSVVDPPLEVVLDRFYRDEVSGG
ncbi:ABC transporter ATP-binding protein [Microlunatus parietis]|uniref:ABC-2 type transport system ATP-binding protein n=1 Tax=Microlunatus parietis TaxID=682979 RepID=A0A7Y9IAD4_9ACTN|nr:ATP-binding cassette domain-containing protein [Microlunatus parietis]NYE73175.1 ABC-2 type transport system ATP-binding protein [Microlunatus parietis]